MREHVLKLLVLAVLRRILGRVPRPAQTTTGENHAVQVRDHGCQYRPEVCTNSHIFVSVRCTRRRVMPDVLRFLPTLSWMACCIGTNGGAKLDARMHTTHTNGTDFA